MSNVQSSATKTIAVLLTTIALFAAVPSAQALSVDELKAALASGDRADADKARDAGRRPAEVVTFLGIKEGMTVLDLIAASGYYTEALSVAVGAKGKVYAQNNDFVLKMREGANEKAITARLAENRLPNVERLNRDVADLGLEAGSVDAAITALNFHDIVNGRGAEATTDFLAAVKGALKTGGVFGIIDHDGNPENDNKELHRMPVADAIKAATDSGFELVSQGEMLRNSKDDRSQGVFTEGLRGHTDRFVLLLRKP